MADPEAIRRFEHAAWQRAAGAYEAAFATATRQFIPGLLDAAGITADSIVLDIACGPGFVAAGARERTAHVRGMDFSAAMLAVARARHPGIPFDAGDAEHLPYPDAAFNAVVSNFGIHHVPNPLLALQEAHRVLGAGGRVAFTIWAEPSENLAWKLVFDAIRAAGDPLASTAPAPRGTFKSAGDCLAALETAGFADGGTTRLSGLWRQADGMALLRSLRTGTARMAALIEAQTDIPAIAAAIDRLAEGYRADGFLAIPIAAIAAFGCKPWPARHAASGRDRREA